MIIPEYRRPPRFQGKGPTITKEEFQEMNPYGMNSACRSGDTICAECASTIASEDALRARAEKTEAERKRLADTWADQTYLSNLRPETPCPKTEEGE